MGACIPSRSQTCAVSEQIKDEDVKRAFEVVIASRVEDGSRNGLVENICLGVQPVFEKKPTKNLDLDTCQGAPDEVGVEGE